MDEKATQLHAIASLKVLLDATKPQNGAATSTAASYVATATQIIDKQETTLAPSSLSSDMPNGVPNTLTDVNMEAVGYLSLKNFICFHFYTLNQWLPSLTYKINNNWFYVTMSEVINK